MFHCCHGAAVPDDCATGAVGGLTTHRSETPMAKFAISDSHKVVWRVVIKAEGGDGHVAR